MNIKGIKIGDKLKFVEEKQAYTIRAKNHRFLICTKPFNPKHTVIYTIVDLKEKIRGTNNFIFNPYNYVLTEDCEQCLRDLMSGEVEISFRRRIPLQIESER
jgi:hypothetical protein